MKSENLVATPYAAKQKQWTDERVWWYVVLARGKVVLHVMPMDYVQNGHGHADFVGMGMETSGQVFLWTSVKSVQIDYLQLCIFWFVFVDARYICSFQFSICC